MEEQKKEVRSNENNNDRGPKKRYDNKRRGRVQIPRFMFRKKKCRLCESDIKELDYKNIELLSRFYTERGKILPRRITGCCAKHQRKVKVALKRARYMALLPFIKIETIKR